MKQSYVWANSLSDLLILKILNYKVLSETNIYTHVSSVTFAPPTIFLFQITLFSVDMWYMFIGVYLETYMFWWPWACLCGVGHIFISFFFFFFFDEAPNYEFVLNWQIFADNTSTLEVTQVATQSTQGSVKRRKLESGWQMLRDSISQHGKYNTMIPWLQLLRALLVKFPTSLPEAEYIPLLAALHQAQISCKR